MLNLSTEAYKMTGSELQGILASVDDALAVYQKHRGTLSAAELSVKSMLIVVRAQIADQLKREIAGTAED
jgi:hypothetical protein